MIDPRKHFEGLTCTINTTEDCNLRCKYCYEINKRPRNIDLDTCKKFINIILKDPDPCGVKEDSQFNWIYNKGICLDFIGGDSFMNVGLLDKICEYFIKQLYLIDNENTLLWRGLFRFSISTNGTLFNDRVKEFCLKYKDSLSIGISIDGCPEIHDLNRVYPNGQGSMHDIIKNWEWFSKEFPYLAQETKATASKNTIPYLYDSLKFMHEELGINYINQNFIMEDMHLTSEDLKEFDRQMEKCVDYCLLHKNDLYWRMLDRIEFANAHLNFGKEWNSKGHCGSGAMPALSIDGNIYPCFRWLSHCQSNNEFHTFKVGSISEGLNHKENFFKVREEAIRCNCTKEEKCKSCEVESACSYCIAGCYAEYGDFIRTTHICDIIKHTVKWSKKYWEEYDKSK